MPWEPKAGQDASKFPDPKNIGAFSLLLGTPDRFLAGSLIDIAFITVTKLFTIILAKNMNFHQTFSLHFTLPVDHPTHVLHIPQSQTTEMKFRGLRSPPILRSQVGLGGARRRKQFNEAI